MANDAWPIRLVVLLGQRGLRRWEEQVISSAIDVLGRDHVIVQEEVDPRGDDPPEKRSFSSTLFRKYAREAAGSQALERIDAPIGAANSTTIVGEAILCLAGARGRVAYTPKHGTWRFITAEGVTADQLPPGVIACIERKPSTSFHLIDAANERLLRSGCFPVLDGDPFVTTDVVLEHAAKWVAQVLNDIRRNGRTAPIGPPPERERVRLPGNMAMISLRISKWLAPVNSQAEYNDGTFSDWNVGLLHQPIHVLLEEGSSMNVRWFPAPSRNRGRLEPFGYTAAGELNVLYRKTDNSNRSSVIARLRPKPDNILKRSRTMLDGGTGHAYPYIVRVQDEAYVLTASFKEDSTSIQAINAANDGLEPGTQLLPYAMHAPTLFEHDGTWWLMGTRDPLGDAALYIHHAPSPFGPFLPHVQNPVKCDVRSTRPAGTPFVHSGTLWRPALDASYPTQSAVVFNKVIELDKDRFAEEPHRRVEGFPATSYGNGLRTVCAMGDVTLVDGLRSPVVSGSKANALSGRKKRGSTKRSEE